MKFGLLSRIAPISDITKLKRKGEKLSISNRHTHTHTNVSPTYRWTCHFSRSLALVLLGPFFGYISLIFNQFRCFIWYSIHLTWWIFYNIRITNSSIYIYYTLDSTIYESEHRTWCLGLMQPETVESCVVLFPNVNSGSDLSFKFSSTELWWIYIITAKNMTWSHLNDSIISPV